jgi:hypothetical protein
LFSASTARNNATPISLGIAEEDGELATRSETPGYRSAARLASDETKSAMKTTELAVAIVTAVAVLIAAAITEDLDSHTAWRYVTYIAIGYMISRGLAKSGSRHTGYDEPGGRRPD